MPIPGSRSSDRVRENVAAAHLRLTEADLELLHAAVPRGATAATRYPPAMLAALDAG